MIVVKVELHGAVSRKITELGRMVICNDGTVADPMRGNYDARIPREGDTEQDALAGKFVRRGFVKDYPRLSYSVWRLVLRALRACYPEEK